ncbi:MAG TPA: nuclear transport factor 2 family protein [Blastocatellia bacterium]|nr:nuclear transport factor 2 family protein [Blastocatellia bacterium]
MIRVTGVLILVVAAATVALAQKHKPQNHTEAKAAGEVIAFLDRLTEAGLRRDVAALGRLYSDDYYHINPDGSIMTRPQVLDSYKAAPTATIESDQHDEDKVWVHGGLAVVHTRITIKGKINNEPYVRQFRVSYLFEKVKGRWRAVTSQATLILQPRG